MNDKMKNVLSFKTETSGLPLWRARSNDEGQPHIVRLAAVLCDGKTQRVIDQMDVVIRPDGWVIPQETIDIHGVTNERALEEGISEAEAVEMFLKLFTGSVRVSSNKQFNNRIIRIALKRFGTEEQQELWHDKEDNFCAMKMAEYDLGNKSITLPEATAHYLGHKPVDNSNSFVNAEAAAMIYFAINNKLGA